MISLTARMRSDSGGAAERYSWMSRRTNVSLAACERPSRPWSTPSNDAKGQEQQPLQHLPADRHSSRSGPFAEHSPVLGHSTQRSQFGGIHDSASEPTRSNGGAVRVAEQPRAECQRSELNARDRLISDGLPAIRSMKQSRHSELLSSEVNALHHLVQDR